MLKGNGYLAWGTIFNFQKLKRKMSLHKILFSRCFLLLLLIIVSHFTHTQTFVRLAFVSKATGKISFNFVSCFKSLTTTLVPLFVTVIHFWSVIQDLFDNIHIQASIQIPSLLIISSSFSRMTS